MSASTEHALYRLRRSRRTGVPFKRYRGTLELSDESTSQVLASCDLIGVATFGIHDIIDHDRGVWQLAANRSIMPSRWLLTDPKHTLVLQFDQQTVRKLVNPFRRTSLVILDDAAEELFRLVDLRTGVLDHVLGASLDGWVLMQKDSPVAKLVWFSKTGNKRLGLLDRLNRLLARSDQGLASAGTAHVLGAPAALALLMLVSELIDPSVGF